MIIIRHLTILIGGRKMNQMDRYFMVMTMILVRLHGIQKMVI